MVLLLAQRGRLGIDVTRNKRGDRLGLPLQNLSGAVGQGAHCCGNQTMAKVFRVSKICYFEVAS
jgi:hypothetical protein